MTTVNYVFYSFLVILSFTSTVYVFAQTSVNDLIDKGIEVVTQGKYGEQPIREAIIYYDKALEIDPNNLDALHLKAGALKSLDLNNETITVMMQKNSKN